MNHPKRHPFPGPGPYRKEKSLEKVGPKEPRGLPKESQGTPKPRKMAPERVSKYVLYPKWARTGSDCLRRRLLKGLRVHFGQFSDDFGWIFFDNAPRNVKKPLRHAELLPHVILIGSQCHTATAEGAKRKSDTTAEASRYYMCFHSSQKSPTTKGQDHALVSRSTQTKQQTWFMPTVCILKGRHSYTQASSLQVPTKGQDHVLVSRLQPYTCMYVYIYTCMYFHT